MQGFCKRISFWSELGVEHRRGAEVPTWLLVLVVTVYLRDKVTSGRRWVRTMGCPDGC